MKIITSLIAFMIVCTGFAGANHPDMPDILDERTRARVVDQWLEQRLDTLPPMLMRREKVDMWILIAREYNEDPVVETMLPGTWMSARRRTILIFHDDGTKVERLAVSRYDIGRFFKSAWNKEEQPSQWARVAEIIEQRKPEKIAINVSSNFGLADGLSHSEYEGFTAALAEPYRSRLVPGENLAIGWLETRIQPEMDMYANICRIAHRIIAEGFSDKNVSPGVTTTEDLEWFYRRRFRELHLDTWFHPSVMIQRAGAEEHNNQFSMRPTTGVILRGDLLHVDLGITYLRLNTDTQQHAYVLRIGETEAPKGLVEALKIGNRLQDILTDNFKTGDSGNKILAASLAQARAESIKATIYTHPLGHHGHGAGPTIGLWDQQGGVPGKGDYPLYANTAYSIELNVSVRIPEWDREVRIMLEEDGFWTGDSFYYIDGRQTEFHLIQ